MCLATPSNTSCCPSRVSEYQNEVVRPLMSTASVTLSVHPNLGTTRYCKKINDVSHLQCSSCTIASVTALSRKMQSPLQPIDSRGGLTGGWSVFLTLLLMVHETRLAASARNAGRGTPCHVTLWAGCPVALHVTHTPSMTLPPRMIGEYRGWRWRLNSRGALRASLPGGQHGSRQQWS